MKYFKILLFIMIASGAVSCGDSVVENIQNDKGPYIPVNHAPVIESIQSDLGALDIIPHMKIVLTVTATDPDGDPVLYTFTTEQGSFNNLIDTGSGCTIDFYTDADISAEEQVFVTVNASDAEGAASSEEYNVGVGLRAPEFDSDDDFVVLESVVLIGPNDDKYFKINREGEIQSAVIEFLTNSKGYYQVQVANNPGITSVIWVEGSGIPFLGNSVVTVYINDTIPGITEGFNRIFIVVQGTTGVAYKYSDIFYDLADPIGSEPEVALSGQSPDPLSPDDYVLIEGDNGGPYQVLNAIDITATDDLEMGGGQIFYTVNGSEPQLSTADPTVPASGTYVFNLPEGTNPVTDFTRSIQLVATHLMTKGIYTVTYRARDKVGNLSSSKYITYWVDNAAPVIELSSTPPSVQYVHTLPFTPYTLTWRVIEKPVDYIIYAVPDLDFGALKTYDDYTVKYDLRPSTPLTENTWENYVIDTNTVSAMAGNGAVEGWYRIIIEATGNNELTSTNGAMRICWDDTEPAVTIDNNTIGIRVGGKEPNCASDKEFAVEITDYNPPGSGVISSGVAMALVRNDNHSTVVFPLGSPVISGDLYTFTFDPCDISGTYPGDSLDVRITAGDNAGNPQTVYLHTFIFDNVAPEVTISQDGGQADPTNVSSINFTADFSEVVSGFSSNDINDTEGTASGWAEPVQSLTDPTIYTITTTGVSDDGDITPSISAGCCLDLAGNANSLSVAGTDNTVRYDSTDPSVVTFEADVLSPTGTRPFTITLEFDEDVNAGLLNTNISNSDYFTCTNCSVSLNPTSGNEQSFTLTVTPDGLAEDTVAVTVDFEAGATKDPAGNDSEAPSASVNVTYDGTRPEVDSFTLNVTSPTNSDSFSATLIFKEKVNVAGLVLGDFTPTSCTLSNIVASDPDNGYATTFIMTVTPNADGNVTVAVNDSATYDEVGNNSIAYSNTNVIVYDITPPHADPFTVSITANPDIESGDPTNVTSIEFSVGDQTSNNDVVSYKYRLDTNPVWSDENDISVPFTIPPVGDPTLDDGTHIVSVIACDALDNCQTSADSTFSWMLDTVPPTVEISDPAWAADPERIDDSGTTIFVRDQVRINYSAQDADSDLASVSIKIVGDGDAGTVVNSTDSNPASNPYNGYYDLSTAAKNDQLYTITLQVTDAAGNVSECAIPPEPLDGACENLSWLQIRSDNTRPIVAVIDQADFSFDGSNFVYVAGGSSNSPANVTVEVEESGSGMDDTPDPENFTITIDGEDYNPSTVSVVTTDYAGPPAYTIYEYKCLFDVNNSLTGILAEAGEGAEGIVSVDIYDNVENHTVPNQDADNPYDIQICKNWARLIGSDTNQTNDAVESVLTMTGSPYDIFAAGSKDGKIFVRRYERFSGGTLWDIKQHSSPYNPYDKSGKIYSIIQTTVDPKQIVAAGWSGSSTAPDAYIISMNVSDGIIYWAAEPDISIAGIAYAVQEVKYSLSIIGLILGGKTNDNKIWAAVVNDDDGTNIRTGPHLSGGALYDQTGCIYAVHTFKAASEQGYFVTGTKGGKPWAATLDEDNNLTVLDEIDTSTDELGASGEVRALYKSSQTTFIVAGNTASDTSGDGWFAKITLNDNGMISSIDNKRSYTNRPVKIICSRYDTDYYYIAGAYTADGTGNSAKAWIAAIYSDSYTTTSKKGEIVWDRYYNDWVSPTNTTLDFNFPINSITETRDVDLYLGLFVGFSKRAWKITPDGDFTW